jgi:hypothetical protein
LAKLKVKGAITMVISVVDIREATKTQLDKHGKEPCKKKAKCP